MFKYMGMCSLVFYWEWDCVDVGFLYNRVLLDVSFGNVWEIDFLYVSVRWIW